MKDNFVSKENNNEELYELHKRITEIDQLEIERNRIEEKLKRVDTKIHMLYDKAEEVITIIQDRHVTYINPSVEKLLGYSPREIIGTPFAHYIHPDELPKIAKLYLQRIAGEDVPNMYETIVRHKNGSDVRIEIKVSTVQYQGRIADLAIVRKAGT